LGSSNSSRAVVEAVRRPVVEVEDHRVEADLRIRSPLATMGLSSSSM
jgi:hypothetical protein